MMISISEYFAKDHDRLDDLFKNFQHWKHSDYRRAKEFFVAFKFGLQRHIVWEEEILFPLFEKKTGMQFGPTYVMRNEHKEIAAHLESIHKKVQKTDPSSDREEQKLLEVLGAHNQKEEAILYPAIDRNLTPEELETVYAAIQNIPEERYLVCCQNA